MNRMSRPTAPNVYHYLSESPRAVSEFSTFYALSSSIPVSRRVERRRVLVLPGLLSSDISTGPLRQFLREAGHAVHGWQLSLNVGPTRRILNGLVERAEVLAEREGGPISVVGWSLGGVLARDLALVRPDLIDRIITLGSPLSITDRSQSRATDVYDMFSELHDPAYSFEDWVARSKMPEVPFSAIYSKADGIVHWQAAKIAETELSENIEVYGSHCGLGANIFAAYVIADRLNADVDSWQPFSTSASLAFAFPSNRSFVDG